MAYSVSTDSRYFQPLGGQSGRGYGAKKGAPAMWSFKTESAHTAVDASGFFNALSGMLSVGDVILVAVVTNRGASNEALSTIGWHVVASNASGVVDCTNVNALTLTDSD